MNRRLFFTILVVVIVAGICGGYISISRSVTTNHPSPEVIAYCTGKSNFLLNDKISHSTQKNETELYYLWNNTYKNCIDGFK